MELSHETIDQAQKVNGGLNAIRAIRPNNPRKQAYINAANDYLRRKP